MAAATQEFIVRLDPEVMRELVQIRILLGHIANEIGPDWVSRFPQRADGKRYTDNA